MSMIDKVFLQRAIAGAQAARQVKQRTRQVQRSAAERRDVEMRHTKQMVATLRSEREAAIQEAKARREAAMNGTMRSSRMSRSAPSLTAASGAFAAARYQDTRRRKPRHRASTALGASTSQVPKLPLARLSGTPGNTGRGGSSAAKAPTVMPVDAPTLQTPSNIWRAINDQVAREARRDEARAKAQRQAHAAQWQRDLAKQMAEQQRALEERKAFDARYVEIEARRMAKADAVAAAKKAKLDAKLAKEARERREQVEEARRRRQAELDRQERERQANNRLMAEQEAKRKAEEAEKRAASKRWLKEVAETNQKNMAHAHKAMLASIDDERRLAKTWLDQLDAQDRRRQEEFDAIYARADKAAAFGESLNVDPEARAKADEARAEMWQTRQIQREQQIAKEKEDKRRALIRDQQRALDAQVAHEERLRKQALTDETTLQKVLIYNDQKALREKAQEEADKRRRNVEYRKELERQRAFDRRRAKNERLPGSMPREEILFNRHRVKVAVMNEPVKAPPKVFGVAARKSQMRASKRSRGSRSLQRVGSSTMSATR